VGAGTLDAPALTGFAAVAAVVQAGLVLLMMRTGRRISRREAAVLVVTYAAAIPFLGAV
jgi:hypothetical protein